MPKTDPTESQCVKLMRRGDKILMIFLIFYPVSVSSNFWKILGPDIEATHTTSVTVIKVFHVKIIFEWIAVGKGK